MGKLSKANHINSGTDLAHNRLDLSHNRMDLAHNKPELCPITNQNCPIRDLSLIIGSGGGGYKTGVGGPCEVLPLQKKRREGQKMF